MSYERDRGQRREFKDRYDSRHGEKPRGSHVTARAKRDEVRSYEARREVINAALNGETV